MNTIFRNVIRQATRSCHWSKSSVPISSCTSHFQLPVNNRCHPRIGSIGIMQTVSLHELHTKGDQELLSFLSEEIATEKKAQRSVTVPKSLDGFSISNDQADVTLTKKFNQEEITVSLNVNHSVDADVSQDPNAPPKSEQGEASEMRSKPNFDVEIKKGNQILTFTCSYIREENTDPQEEYNDAFVVDEISLHEGELKEQVYIVAGDILDGYLYDLFMNMLEERGVSNEFVEKLSDYCTDYEHKLYVDLLQKLEGFIGSK